MKILGVSLGSRNGNNDTMCRVALEAARNEGAEIEFIHLMDWNIEHCTGCCACSVGLVTGKGNICTRKDDFAAFWDKICESDGILFVDPIFESGSSGLFKTIADRFGPGHDLSMNIVGDKLSKEKGGPGVDARIFRKRATSYIGIGGSDWFCRVYTDHAMVSMSPAWPVIDNEIFGWSKDIIMHEDAIARCQEIGRNLVHAAQDLLDGKEAKWMGKKGICTHCNGNNFYIEPGTNKAICELCGLEGEIQMEGTVVKFVFPPEDEYKAHDTESGKFLHADDIMENEGRLMNLKKDPEFKARKKYYTDIIAPTPAPAKAKK